MTTLPAKNDWAELLFSSMEDSCMAWNLEISTKEIDESSQTTRASSLPFLCMNDWYTFIKNKGKKKEE
jgi:hypothetical protein